MIADTTGMTLINVSKQRTALLHGASGFFPSLRYVIDLFSAHVFKSDAQRGVMIIKVIAQSESERSNRRDNRAYVLVRGLEDTEAYRTRTLTVGHFLEAMQR
jgi:hypothetical protein